MTHAIGTLERRDAFIPSTRRPVRALAAPSGRAHADDSFVVRHTPARTSPTRKVIVGLLVATCSVALILRSASAFDATAACATGQHVTVHSAKGLVGGATLTDLTVLRGGNAAAMHATTEAGGTVSIANGVRLVVLDHDSATATALVRVADGNNLGSAAWVDATALGCS